MSNGSTILPNTSSTNGRSTSPTPSLWTKLREDYVILPKKTSSSTMGDNVLPLLVSSGCQSGTGKSDESESKEQLLRKALEAAGSVTRLVDEITSLKGQFDDEMMKTLREMILNSKFHARLGPSQTLKQACFYTSGTIAGPNTTQITLPVNRLSLNTNRDGRLGLSVKQYHLTLRMVFNVFQNGAPSLAPSVVPPQMRMLFLRDKVPLVPGTAAVLWAASADPPNGTALFSNLGSSVATRGTSMTAVVDPTQLPFYHIYKDEFLIDYKDRRPNGSDVIYPFVAGTNQQIPGYFRKIEWEIPLHGVKSQYPGGVGQDPQINALLLYLIPDTSATQSIQYQVSSQLSYDDTDTQE